jgi:hypothetical protein
MRWAIDLIAVAEDGSIILIDVKTYRQAGSENCFRKTGERTPKQIEMGVQVLGFDPRDRKCYFVEHRDETTYTRHRDEQQHNTIWLTVTQDVETGE